MTRFWTRMLRWYSPPILLLAVVVLAYLGTLAQGVMPEDAGEFQTRYYTLEPAHPTGYPLLILLGKLWVTLWPLGSVADRANVLSALLSAGAALAAYATVMQLTARPLAAWVAGLALAFTPSLWFYSTKAGPYPFHIFLLSLAWLTLVRWQQGRGRLTAPALVVGMCLAHHRMAVMSVPAIGVFVLLRDPGLLRRGRDVLKLLALLLLPWLSYILLPLYGIWPLSRFLSHAFLINSPMGRLAFPVRGLVAWAQRLVEVVWPNLCEGVGLVGVLLSLAGLGLYAFASSWPCESRSRRLQVSVALLLTIVTYSVFSASYAIVPDDRRYYVPIDLTLVIGIGLAAGWALRQAGRFKRAALAWAWRGGVALSLLALPAWEFHRHRPTTDQAHGAYVAALTREGLAAVETDAVIVTTPGFTTAYWYYQQVEGWRPDVTVHMDGVTIGEEGALALLDAGQPVYFRQPLYGLDRADSEYAWLPFLGGLDCAVPRLPAAAWTLEPDHDFGQDIRLQAAAASDAVWAPDTPVLLWLRWQVGSQLPADAGLSVWLEGPDGRRWWQEDRSWAVLTSELAPGEALTTTHYLVAPPGMPPGLYHWRVQITGQGASDSALWEAEVEVVRPQVAPVAARFPQVTALSAPMQAGPLRLLGVGSTQDGAQAGGYLFVQLLWQAVDAPGADWQMRLRLVRADLETETALAAPLPGFPTSEWQPGDTLLGLNSLRVPANWPSGRYRLKLEWQGPDGLASLDMGTVAVEARSVQRRAPAIASPRDDRLDEAFRLLGYDLAPGELAPGETLHLTLYWEAVEAPSDNYKVFTHLVGSDGFLAAQQDGLPGGSLVLTGEWVRGEVVVDEYTLSVAADAPPGEYVLYVGMYRASDGYRLSAWDGSGQRWVNDAIAVDAVEIEER
ncbi:MAG: DUF2723 domain-containing protein [Anaerolineales bacterium]|nr:DUF2723 domain-containing protein [Anaerolineales bacterium]